MRLARPRSRPGAHAIATAFDDRAEELDPEFQKSLKLAAKEHRAGKSVALEGYLKKRAARPTG